MQIEDVRCWSPCHPFSRAQNSQPRVLDQQFCGCVEKLDEYTTGILGVLGSLVELWSFFFCSWIIMVVPPPPLFVQCLAILIMKGTL